MGMQAEKRLDRKSSGTRQKNKGGDRKWNQMTALRFQTGGKTSDIPDLPSGVFYNTERGKEDVTQHI